MNHDTQLDRPALRRNLNRARRYDQSAFLQQEIMTRMFERLDLIKVAPAVILDIGAKTGVTTQCLQQRYSEATVIAYDFADKLLGQYDDLAVVGDMEQLPFADQSVDFIFSNLQYPWSDELGYCFTECLRVLKPNGLFLFSTLGVDTLGELRQSFAAVNQAMHVHDFIDMHHIGDALLQVGFSDPVMDAEWLTLTYKNIDKLLDELRSTGSVNVLSNRHRGLTGKNKWQAMLAAYENFRQDGRLPATFEIVYGHAWVPKEAKGARADESGEIIVSVDQISGRG